MIPVSITQLFPHLARLAVPGSFEAKQGAVVFKSAQLMGADGEPKELVLCVMSAIPAAAPKAEAMPSQPLAVMIAALLNDTLSGLWQ